jgi:transcriptional regulator with XRE-family HTH domain
VTFQQIQKYEKGTNRVTLGRLQPLARALGVPVSYFTEGSDEQPTEFDNFLALPGSRDLMAAFVAIEDADTRKALLKVMQAAAGPGAERVSASKKRRSSP